MNRIDEIIQSRQQISKPEEQQTEEDKFFSILLGDVIHEHFLELKFSNGLQTCFSYTDLLWFVHDPELGSIDLAFGGFLVTIKGRGLLCVFDGVKQKRVAWIKEADAELQDHKGNETFIEAITITPPRGFEDESNVTPDRS